MKRFHVFVEFISGIKIDFTTKSDIRKEMFRQKIDGEDCIVTDDNIVLNVSKIKALKIQKVNRYTA
ncbi:hypothetical protein [Halalkalibacter krulwichiae]|uniref:Uncharacterized protein n=1 Tax=Halalkalibacter krulwichiae TaxID=199441 RepID=A0A1X9MBE5_9BACI|nr:hypothetical protein [Halalkalibacter krulwichiae]ARK30747.1 hypothetical protein BkAM31D_13400 [Halalkalibacter krulwichiae]